MEVTGTQGATDRAPARSSEHWLLLGGAVTSNLGLVGMGLFLEPDGRGYGTHEKLGLQPCLPLKLWNVPCPGCGVTTAVTHATHGDLATSVATQPFGLGVVAMAIFTLLYAVVLHLRGRDAWRGVCAWPWRRIGIVSVAYMVLAWIYKTVSLQGWV